MAEQVSRKPYEREVPRLRWFFRHPRYLRYMAREVTCIFIGAYTILLLVGVKRLSEGQAAYEAFLQALTSGTSVVFHVLALAFSAYHSATWFNVTPKALPVQLGETFVAGSAIAGLHYAGWAALTVAVLYLGGAF